MFLYLGLLLFSFLVNSAIIVPFIDLLYKYNFTRQRQTTKDFLDKKAKIFDRLNKGKEGTPTGGGIIMIISLVTFQFLLLPSLNLLGIYIKTSYPLIEELNILFFTIISFGLLGLYDDSIKIFGFKKNNFFGLRMRHKFIIQWLLGFIAATLLFVNLKIDFIYIPFIGPINLGYLYIPFAASIIVWFTNAFNITDGLDGLSSGLLLICLFAFWIISYQSLDIPLTIFIVLWIGSLLSFLYFNVFPARIMLGDVGALAFGAMLAVIGLLTGKIVALFIIGGFFAIEGLSSFLQIMSKKFLKRKLFKVAPFHLWLRERGWEEPKVVMRAWIAGIVLAIFGLWLSVV